jgi:hypothetical protein
MRRGAKTDREQKMAIGGTEVVDARFRMRRILFLVVDAGRRLSGNWANSLMSRQSGAFFHRPPETGFVQDCVVGLVGLKPATKRL